MAASVAPGGVLSTGTYFGRVLSRARTPGLLHTETVYRRGEDLPPHAHERAFFCLTLGGAYNERTAATGETEYEPFTAVFHPAGEEHLTRIGRKGGRLLNVEVDPDRLAELAELSTSPAGVRDLGGGPLVWLLVRLHRAAGRAGDEEDSLDCEALGAELLGTVVRAGRRDKRAPRWLSRVTERLAADRTAPSVRDLAREAGVHPVHLARVFRRFHGVPPGLYRRRLRIQRACRLLGLKGLRLAEVAAHAGFSDQSHLSRELRAVLGETPARFRRAEP
jgi:AraC family transcriptional regulator